MSSESPQGGQDCRSIEPMLDDLVDGQLTMAQQRQVETHLADCSACSAHLTSLRSLLQEVAELPRSIEPEKHLWAEISPRLVERKAIESPSLAPAGTSGRWAYWLRQAVAAVALMVLGGVLSQVWLSGGIHGERSVHSKSSPVDSVSGGAPSEEDYALAEARLALAEADFLRAKEALWSAVYSSRNAASPETREVVERNLAVIAGAIQELRSALEADPGNPQLEGLLLAQHRSEIGLLQRLARSAEI